MKLYIKQKELFSQNYKKNLMYIITKLQDVKKEMLQTKEDNHSI